MARRPLHLAVLVAVLVLATPTAASADYSVQLEAPDTGTVTGPVEVRFRVARDVVDPEIRAVAVRLAAGGEHHPTRCVDRCSSRSPVFAFDLDPRAGTPFASGPLANGRLEFVAVVTRAVGSDRTAGPLALDLRVPGSAVGGLAATVSGEEVRVAWQRAPEPDVAGYRVERCGDGCDVWSAIDVLPASASSYTQRPGPGSYGYRVVTVRSGGDDGTIETVSSPVTATVEPPPAHERAGAATSRPAGGSSTVRSRPQDADDAAAVTRAGPPDLPGATTPTRRPGRVDLRRGTSLTLGRGSNVVPALPDASDIYRGTLDYGLDDEVAGTGRGDAPGPGADDAVILSAPGAASGSFVGRLTDPDLLAVPLAGGLLLTAIGLHLWRWLRVPL